MSWFLESHHDGVRVGCGAVSGKEQRGRCKREEVRLRTVLREAWRQAEEKKPNYVRNQEELQEMS